MLVLHPKPETLNPKPETLNPKRDWSTVKESGTVVSSSSSWLPTRARLLREEFGATCRVGLRCDKPREGSKQVGFRDVWASVRVWGGGSGFHLGLWTPSPETTRGPFNPSKCMKCMLGEHARAGPSMPPNPKPETRNPKP